MNPHGQVHASRLLSLDQARAWTGLDLVSGCDVYSPITKRSYDAMEREAESAPHQLMRELGQHFFVSYGYKVYPHGVGVSGFHCLADFLALRDGRILFVEALTDATLSLQSLAAKRSLERFGEVVFLVMSGPRGSQHPGTLAVKSAMAAVCDTVAVHCDPARRGNCEALTPFPRFAFALPQPRSGIPLVVTMADPRHHGKRMRMTLAWGTKPFAEPVGIPIFSWPPRAIDHYERLQAFLAHHLRAVHSWRATSELPHRTWFALGTGRQNIATLSTDQRGLAVAASVSAGGQFLDALSVVGRRCGLSIIHA